VGGLFEVTDGDYDNQMFVPGDRPVSKSIHSVYT